MASCWCGWRRPNEAVRARWLAVLLVSGACGGAVELVPRPLHLSLREGTLASRRPLAVTLAPPSEAIRFAIETLNRDLPAIRGASGPRLLAGLLGRPAIDREIAARRLDPAEARKSEGYLLDVRPQGILAAASTEAGLFYAIQTLRQLARKHGGTYSIPHLTAADSPALRHRGLSVDISRGPVLAEPAMRGLIETLAEFKMNLLTFYMEHVFPYDHAPLAAPATGLGAETFARLADYARRHHIDLVPQQQMFGHLHHVLKVESYTKMGERPHGSVLAPGDPGAEEWVGQAARQLARVFPSPFLHIGCDETFELGRGRSRERVAREGFEAVYLAHLKRVAELLRPLNRRLMFWGDMALAHPALLAALPKELIPMSWDYHPRQEYASLVEPFRRHGFEFFVCPGVNNWQRIFPRIDAALANIGGFVEEGKRAGALGMLNTHWNDGGEGLLNLTWYPVVFSAAAAWQREPVEEGAFAASFDWVFHRAGSPSVARIVDRFRQAGALLAQAGFDGAATHLFWEDPFSAAGARSMNPESSYPAL